MLLYQKKMKIKKQNIFNKLRAANYVFMKRMGYNTMAIVKYNLLLTSKKGDVYA